LAFVLNGTIIRFKTEDKTEISSEVVISHVAREIYYHINDHGDICCSLDNVQARLAFPGLLKNYPEAGARKDNFSQNESTEIVSPLHGKIMEIYINENQLIKKGDPLLVIEAMKSENHIVSHRDARVKKIAVKVGAQVTDRMPLIYLED
jgi:acetyl/propionyl-CoA carboxylase alpha subunit